MAYYDRNGGDRRLNIAVVGSGVFGLSAAWLLAKRHDATVFEASGRIGGDSNTGFIVYNEASYPNLTALFCTLGVLTSASHMTYAVSLNDGEGSDEPA